MSIRTVVLAALGAGLLASAAAAADATPAPAGDKSGSAQPAPASTTGATQSADATQSKGEEHSWGQKKYKERINVVARKPDRHDVAWIDSRDRTSWRTFTQWQGVRDERPMVARKVFGFHEPRPHVRRAERVERLARGPLRGPAPSE
jgi:hypothetical protein